MSAHAELKQKLVTACRILDAEGIMDELGHFSVRTPDGNILMNGKVSPGQATEGDMVLLDLEGNKVEGSVEAAKEIQNEVIQVDDFDRKAYQDLRS